MTRTATVVLCLFVWGTAFAQDEPVPAAPANDQPEAAEESSAAEAPADTGTPTVSDSNAATPAVAAERPRSLTALAARLDHLTDRTEQIRGRVEVLKGAVLEGGTSASATILYSNEVTSQFRLSNLTVTVDGAQVFTQHDDGSELHSKQSIDILTGPIRPGKHTVTVVMEFRGHGYGPFKYLNKQSFIVRGTHVFSVSQGKAIKLNIIGYERNDVPLEERPAARFSESEPAAQSEPAAPPQPTK